MMLSETSQWHITMPVGGGIHAINKAEVNHSGVPLPCPVGLKNAAMVFLIY
jgi:hypothetical protein